MIALQRELRDKSAQLHLAKSRYDQLEEKARAQREIQERTLGRLDEYNRTVRDLRRKLQVAESTPKRNIEMDSSRFVFCL